MLILVLMVYAVFVLYEFIPLYKQKLWREFGVNIILGLFSLFIAIMLCFDVKIPSPSYPIKEFITLIFGK